MTPDMSALIAKNFVYISDFDSGLFSRINTVGDKVQNLNYFPKYTTGIAVTSKNVYLANADVTVTDSSGNLVATIGASSICGGAAAGAVGVTPDEKKAYVSCWTVGSAYCNQIGVINTLTNKVTKILYPGNTTSCSGGVVASPDNQKVYVAKEDGLVVIDTNTDSVMTTVSGVYGRPVTGITVTPDSKIIYIANDGGNTVWAIDAATNTLISTIPVGRSPYGIEVVPDSIFKYKVYVANSGDNTVSVIGNNTVIATIVVGNQPSGVSATSDWKRIYITNYKSKTVSVIDTVTDKILTSVSIGGGAATGKFISPSLP